MWIACMMQSGSREIICHSTVSTSPALNSFLSVFFFLFSVENKAPCRFAGEKSPEPWIDQPSPEGIQVWPGVAFTHAVNEHEPIHWSSFCILQGLHTVTSVTSCHLWRICKDQYTCSFVIIMLLCILHSSSSHRRHTCSVMSRINWVQSPTWCCLGWNRKEHLIHARHPSV